MSVVKDHKHNNDTNFEDATPPKEEPYDVILCGTDLIQSILSSALSRAGKKVLHCDGNDWYGGFDAILYGGSTLDLFIEGCNEHQQQQNQQQQGIVDSDDTYTLHKLQLLSREKYGDLKLHSRSFIGDGGETTTSNNNDGDQDVAETLVGISIQDDKEKTQHEENDNATTNENDNDATYTANKLNEEEEEHTYQEGGVPQVVNENNEEKMTQQTSINPMEHGFCFDLTPSLIYASGDAVQGLVKSGVADYLEFKSLKGLYLLMEVEEEKMKKKSSTRSGKRGRKMADKGKEPELSNTGNNVSRNDGSGSKKLAAYRVPSSKGDVFKSKLLSPVDKRKLMKFLQLISDYGIITTQLEDDQSPLEDGDNNTKEGEKSDAIDNPNSNSTVAGEGAIQSINERHLHTGRALSRPQNKATPKSSEMDELLRCVRDNISFSDFLTIVSKLPERLRDIVIYAMALSPVANLEQTKGTDNASIMSQYSTKEGVDDLVRHVTALGKFGDSAFLVPMYGSGELSQAFCRSGAVYGSTYMLRRSPVAVSFDKDSNRVQGVVLSGEEHIGGSDDLDTDDVSDKELPCKHVIVPSTMLSSPTKVGDSTAQQGRTFRRISIIQGKLMLDLDHNDTKVESDREQRYAIIIPPGTGGLENKSAIHGLAVDESAFVAPPRKNCTVLHLTTSSRQEDDTPDEVYVDALSKAVEYLIASQPTTVAGAASPIKECHHISFSYSTATTQASYSGKEEDMIHQNTNTTGLHICHRDQQSLTCDSAFREAKKIFYEICPDSDFLALAKKVEDAIVYREENDSDDEKMVLETACTMIQHQTTVENDKTLIEAAEEDTKDPN